MSGRFVVSLLSRRSAPLAVLTAIVVGSGSFGCRGWTRSGLLGSQYKGGVGAAGGPLVAFGGEHRAEVVKRRDVAPVSSLTVGEA